MPRIVSFRLWVDWDFNGVYTDESAYLSRASGENRLSPPADFLTSGRGIIDRCQLELRNPNGRFSPLNESGPLYSYISSGGAYHAPMYLEVSIDGGSTYARVFTGVAKLPQESGLTSKANPLVTVECRSRDELLLQQRASTTLGDFQGWHDAGYTEAQIISALLTAAGQTNTAIDPGMVAIPWVWLDDESILEEIWQLAAAAGGRFYCDPNGVFRYENATHWLYHGTSQETLTRASYQSLQASYDDANLYSTITVESSSRLLGAPDVLWEPDEAVVVPPNGSKNLTARLSQAAYLIDDVTFSAAAAGGENLNAYVTVSQQTKYAQRVELTFANSNPYWAAYLRACRITGRPLQGGPTQEETRKSASSFFDTNKRGGRTRSVRANNYVQSRAQAAMLADFLLRQSEAPRLKYAVRGCPGVPGRRCGDRVTLNDSSVMSTARDVFITSISWRLGSHGFNQDLECIDAAGLYPYQTTGYFIVNSSTLNGGKPMFY